MSDISATGEFATAFSNWRRTVSLLMLQYLSSRTLAGRLSLLLIFLEPIIFILSFYVIRTIYHGVIQLYGPSILLFLASGMFPYYAFKGSATLSRAAKPLQPLPRIRPMDVLVAQVATSGLIWLIDVAVFHLALWLYGVRQARPESILVCAEALFYLLIFGIGIGLINSTISRFFPLWRLIFGIITRGGMFLSGVIHVPDYYDYWIRRYLVWNPILHGVDWYRLGIYGNGYPHAVLDINYLVKCAVIALFVGLIADRASLRFAGR